MEAHGAARGQQNNQQADAAHHKAARLALVDLRLALLMRQGKRLKLADEFRQLLAGRLAVLAQRVQPALKLLDVPPFVELRFTADEPLATLGVAKNEAPEVKTVRQWFAVAEAALQVIDFIKQLFVQQQQEIQGRGGALAGVGSIQRGLVGCGIALQRQLSAQAAQFLADAPYARRAITRGEMRLEQARNPDRVHIIQVILR